MERYNPTSSTIILDNKGLVVRYDDLLELLNHIRTIQDVDADTINTVITHVSAGSHDAS